jgi:hypothetical protein
MKDMTIDCTTWTLHRAERLIVNCRICRKRIGKGTLYLTSGKRWVHQDCWLEKMREREKR